MKITGENDSNNKHVNGCGGKNPCPSTMGFSAAFRFSRKRNSAKQLSYEESSLGHIGNEILPGYIRGLFQKPPNYNVLLISKPAFCRR